VARAALGLGVCLVCAVTAAGCGESGGGGAPPPAPLEGTAAPAAAGATVEVYRIGPDGGLALVTRTTTDDAGAFAVPRLGGGAYLVVAGGGEAYVDPATGADRALAPLPAMAELGSPRDGTLSAIVGFGGRRPDALHLNALTTIAAARVAALAAGDETALDAGEVAAVHEALAAELGLDAEPVDPRDVAALDPSDPADAPAVARDPGAPEAGLGLLLAALSQSASAAGADPTALVDALAADFRDGSFNGRDGAEAVDLGGGDLPPTQALTDLAKAVLDFLAGPRNASGASADDFAALVRAASRQDEGAPGVNRMPSFVVVGDRTARVGLPAVVTLEEVGPGPGDGGQAVPLSAAAADPAVIPAVTVGGSGQTRTLTFTPAAEGATTVRIEVVDDGGVAGGGLDRTVLELAVTVVNGAPAAAAQSVTTREDAPVAITLAGTGPEGAPLSYAVVTGPTRGTLSGAAPDLVYTPDPEASGSDAFAFRVSRRGEDLGAARTTSRSSWATGAAGSAPRRPRPLARSGSSPAPWRPATSTTTATSTSPWACAGRIRSPSSWATGRGASPRPPAPRTRPGGRSGAWRSPTSTTTGTWTSSSPCARRAAYPSSATSTTEYPASAGRVRGRSSGGRERGLRARRDGLAAQDPRQVAIQEAPAEPPREVGGQLGRPPLLDAEDRVGALGGQGPEERPRLRAGHRLGEGFRKLVPLAPPQRRAQRRGAVDAVLPGQGLEGLALLELADELPRLLFALDPRDPQAEPLVASAFLLEERLDGGRREAVAEPGLEELALARALQVDERQPLGREPAPRPLGAVEPPGPAVGVDGRLQLVVAHGDAPLPGEGVDGLAADEASPRGAPGARQPHGLDHVLRRVRARVQPASARTTPARGSCSRAPGSGRARSTTPSPSGGGSEARPTSGRRRAARASCSTCGGRGGGSRRRRAGRRPGWATSTATAASRR